MKEEKEPVSLETSTPHAPSAPSIGHRLHSARLKKGLTIEVVNQETRMSKRFIMAMEEDRLDEIPGGSYLVSFLKGYCEYLELDFREMEELLMSQGRLASPEIEDVQVNSASPKRSSLDIFFDKASKLLSWGPQKIFWAAIVLLLVGLAMVQFKKPPVHQGKGNVVVSSTEHVVAAPPRAVPMKQKGESLAILFKRSVFLKVAIDGKRRFSGRVVGGTRQDWQAMKEITLWTRDPEALGASLNGAPLQLPLPDAKGNFHIKVTAKVAKIRHLQRNAELGTSAISRKGKKMKGMVAVPDSAKLSHPSANKPPVAQH